MQALDTMESIPQVDAEKSSKWAARWASQKRYYYKDLEKTRKRARERSAKYRTRYTSAEIRLRSGDAAKYLFWGCIKRARKKGFEFDLTREWLEERHQKGCAITGITFDVGRTVNNNGRSASIDRIDNSRGYTQDNCRLILNAINCFKGTMTDAEMHVLAIAIVGGMKVSASA